MLWDGNKSKKPKSYMQSKINIHKTMYLYNFCSFLVIMYNFENSREDKNRRIGIDYFWFGKCKKGQF